MDREVVWNRPAVQIGANYNLAGIALAFALAVRHQSDGRRFCFEHFSEAAGHTAWYVLMKITLFLSRSGARRANALIR